MKDFWTTLAEATEGLHADKLKALAGNVSRLSSHLEFSAVVEDFGSRTLGEVKDAWFANPEVAPSEVAAALSFAACSKDSKSDETIELVWTGPDTSLVPSRDTRQVIGQVIDSARASLFIVSYAMYKVDGVLDKLSKVIDNGIEVSVLLESPESEGGRISQDNLSKFSKAVPKANLYVWDPSDRDTGVSVHAKCVVADQDLAFITSANLTSAALDRNMELGVLFRGGPTPKTLRAHLDALVATQIVTPWA